MNTYEIIIVETGAQVAEFDTSAEGLEALENTFNAADENGMGLFALQVKAGE